MKENEDFLPIILKTSSLSLFSSVSLFVLIDTGKSGAFGGGDGIDISPARRSLAKGGYQWGTGWKVNAAVHKTASPETFRDWRIDR